MPSAATFHFQYGPEWDFLVDVFITVVVAFIIAAFIFAVFTFAFPKAVARAPSPYYQYSDIMDLCMNRKRLPESELLRQLERMKNKNPKSLQSKGAEGSTPLHYAAFGQSPEFCKQLIQAGAPLLSAKTTNQFNELPFLCACRSGNIETAEYLFGLYPESINKHDDRGCYPIHDFAHYVKQKPLDVIHGMARLLLTNDQGAISVATQTNGDLPLHRACSDGGEILTMVKILFDAYPGAIFVRNNDGNTPIELARSLGLTEVVSFLEGQLELVQQLTIHEALQNLDVPSGTIKLLIETYPNSLRLADSQRRLPLHIACQTRGFDVVKCLIDAEAETGFKSLEVLDESQSLPLHHACRRGKVDIINYILKKSEYGVGMPSADQRLPIHLLLSHDNCDTNNLEYIGSFGCLLRANPTAVITPAML